MEVLIVLVLLLFLVLTHRVKRHYLSEFPYEDVETDKTAMFGVSF